MESYIFVEIIIIFTLVCVKKSLVSSVNDKPNNKDPDYETIWDDGQPESLYSDLKKEGSSDIPEKSDGAEGYKVEVKPKDDVIVESREDDVELIELDIKEKGKKKNYIYMEYQGTGIYNARNGCSFICVKQKESVIWESKGKDDRGYRVVVKGIGSSRKKVLIYKNGNKNQVFWKNGKGKPWEDSRDPSANDPNYVGSADSCLSNDTILTYLTENTND